MNNDLTNISNKFKNIHDELNIINDDIGKFLKNIRINDYYIVKGIFTLNTEISKYVNGYKIVPRRSYLKNSFSITYRLNFKISSMNYNFTSRAPPIVMTADYNYDNHKYTVTKINDYRAILKKYDLERFSAAVSNSLISLCKNCIIMPNCVPSYFNNLLILT